MKLERITSPRLFSGSILKTLIAVHFAVLALGFLGFFLFLQYSSAQRIRGAILDIKQQVQPLLSAHQDRWRAWHMLGLKDVLTQNLEHFQREHPEVRVSVVEQDSQTLPHNAFDIPANKNPGEIVVRGEILTTKLLPQKQLVEYATASAFLLVALFLVSLLLSTFLIRKHIQHPLSVLRKRVGQIDNRGEFSARDIPAVGEIKQLLDLIDTLYKRTKQNEKLSIIGEVAQQVAHDIRSPLAALNLTISSATTLPEAQRRLIQSAIVRINDIANNLADKKRRELLPSDGGENAFLTPQYLFSMLRETLNQKSTEFSTETGVSLRESGLVQMTRAFSEVEPGQFKTMLSNLINNAREALGKAGIVEIKTERVDGHRARITVSDNGKGIPPEAVSRIGERGFSLDKPDGTGLGLYHATENIRKWGGTLTIQSEVGVGTDVTIELPLVAAPSWFHDSIEVPFGADIAIVDDDPSIHELWRFRLRDQSDKVALHHFFTIPQLKLWMKDRPVSEKTVFLVDQEFVGQIDEGLDLVREFDLMQSAYLVTSRSEDGDFLARCVAARVRIIPKCNAEFTSLRLRSPQEDVAHA